MNRFLKDNKLQVPLEEIDNVYLWTRVTKTQEVLLSAKTYYDWAVQSFNADTLRVQSVLRTKLPSISENSYQFSDFITFMANKSKIFNDNTCFVYSTSSILLDSLACFLAHTMNRYLPENDSLPSLIINKIDEPEKFTTLMDKDFIILSIYAPLPDHKYRNAILDSLLARRSRAGFCTLIYLLNTGLLIDEDLISKDRAKRYKLVDISPMASILQQRRSADYKEIMKIWLELLAVDINNFVYSKTEPKQQFRKVDRYTL